MSETRGFGDFAQTSNSKSRIKRFRGRDMQTQLVELSQAAAIIRAVFFERLPAGATEAERKQKLNESVRQAEAIGRKRTDRADSQALNRLERLIEDLENGFSMAGQPIGKPYGNPASERPRITIAGRQNQSGGG